MEHQISKSRLNVGADAVDTALAFPVLQRWSPDSKKDEEEGKNNVTA